ncbi:MAG: hypothetical protein JWL83_2893 [Actinomycetia bacterium]|nr:hypothetical protein [Actinomycetes bacterium]
MVAIVLSRGTNANAGAPQSGDHWHAALGVYLCDHWQGDANWVWPSQTSSGTPARPDGTYAGLHSHADGIIHIEPSTSDEMGKNATLGTYFKFGGWKLSSTEINFVGADKKAGDKCGSKPGEVRWEVNGKVQTGNPARYKLKDGDAIVVAFVPADFNMKTIAQPPSVKNLAGAGSREGQAGVSTTTPANTSTGSSSTLPGATTPTTVPTAPPTTVAGATTTVPGSTAPTTSPPTTAGSSPVP